MRLSIEFVWTTRATQNIFIYIQCWSLPKYMNSYYYQESQVLESGNNFMIVKILNLRCDYQLNLCECREQRNMEGISVFRSSNFQKISVDQKARHDLHVFGEKFPPKGWSFPVRSALKYFYPADLSKEDFAW